MRRSEGHVEEEGIVATALFFDKARGVLSDLSGVVEVVVLGWDGLVLEGQRDRIVEAASAVDRAEKAIEAHWRGQLSLGEPIGVTCHLPDISVV